MLSRHDMLWREQNKIQFRSFSTSDIKKLNELGLPSEHQLRIESRCGGLTGNDFGENKDRKVFGLKTQPSVDKF